VADFARDVLGLTLYPKQAAILDEWDERRPAESVESLGRRSGKTLMAGARAVHNAVVEDYTGLLRPGERRYIVCVATTQDQARIALRTIGGLFGASSRLASLVASETADEILLKNNVVIRALPCSARAGRGLPVSMVILDELAHFTTTEEGNAAGSRVYAALAPSVAQFGDKGHVIAISTPYAKQGAFWDLFQLAMSGQHPSMMAVQAPTWEVNPTIPQEWLDRQRAKDPDLYRVEYGAEFTAAIAGYLDGAAVWACVSVGVRERAPVEGQRYSFGIDPAYVGDRFALVGATRIGDRISVDVVRTWRGTRTQPVQHSAVLGEIKGLSDVYNRAGLHTDQFAAEPIRQGLSALGCSVTYAPWTNESKAAAFSALKQAINTGEIVLPDDAELVRELGALEIRQTAGGKPKIGAPSGGHDDIATALAAAVAALTSPREAAGEVIDPEPGYADRRRSFALSGRFRPQVGQEGAL
jgi:hypothetical protein